MTARDAIEAAARPDAIDLIKAVRLAELRQLATTLATEEDPS